MMDTAAAAYNRGSALLPKQEKECGTMEVISAKKLLAGLCEAPDEPITAVVRSEERR